MAVSGPMKTDSKKAGPAKVVAGPSVVSKKSNLQQKKVAPQKKNVIICSKPAAVPQKPQLTEASPEVKDGGQNQQQPKEIPADAIITVETEDSVTIILEKRI